MKKTIFIPFTLSPYYIYLWGWILSIYFNLNNLWHPYLSLNYSDFSHVPLITLFYFLPNILKWLTPTLYYFLYNCFLDDYWERWSICHRLPWAFFLGMSRVWSCNHLFSVQFLWVLFPMNDSQEGSETTPK